jgi:hypothetical protein
LNQYILDTFFEFQRSTTLAELDVSAQDYLGGDHPSGEMAVFFACLSPGCTGDMCHCRDDFYLYNFITGKTSLLVDQGNGNDYYSEFSVESGMFFERDSSWIPNANKFIFYCGLAEEGSDGKRHGDIMIVNADDPSDIVNLTRTRDKDEGIPMILPIAK